MIKHKIISLLNGALNKIGVKQIGVYLEHPVKEGHGDYATSAALQLARIPRKGNFLENIEWFWKNINRKNFAGYRVDLPAGRLGKNVVEMIGASESKVWLRSIIFAKIRGWREKEGFTGHPEIDRRYFRSIPLVLVYPEHVVKRNKKRYLLIGRLQKQFTLVIEIDIQGKKNWLVSAFMTRERYLKKREKNCLQHKKKGIPAGTAVSPILASLNKLGSGGSRFSTLQDTQVFYTKLERKSQEDILTYEERKSSMEWAEETVKSLPKLPEIEKIEIKKPGFINFWLSKEYLLSEAAQITEEKDDFGRTKIGKGKKLLIEFGQPNTHKLPHIGHFRSYALGESLSRLLEFSGYEVFRANYQGDVGLHVAKCLWGYQRKAQGSTPNHSLRSGTGQGFKARGLSLEEKIKLLQDAYVYGNKMYEESKEAKKEIEELNIKIYGKDKSIASLWNKTRKWSVDYYELLNKRLDTKYHQLYFESECAQEGKKIVLKNLGKVFKKSRGAIIFPGEKYGLHNRVFLTSQGNPTYEAKDLGLIFLKEKDFDYDLSLISTASEQIEYFKVVYKAAEQIAPTLAKKFIHIPFGMVSLTGGKLSSRKGEIVSIGELLESVEKALVFIMKEKDYSQKEIQEALGELTIGASKYSILKNTPLKDMIFNIKESVALEGNSGPYLQYTYARCKSVLRKIGSQHFITIVRKNVTLSEIGDEEMAILRTLYKFAEVVYEAGKNYSPNLICSFLFDLAQKYNLFYQKIPILNAKNAKARNQRLLLTQATAQVLKNGLRLLGIKVLERM